MTPLTHWRVDRASAQDECRMTHLQLSHELVQPPRSTDDAAFVQQPRLPDRAKIGPLCKSRTLSMSSGCGTSNSTTLQDGEGRNSLASAGSNLYNSDAIIGHLAPTVYDVHEVGFEALHVVVWHNGQLALRLHLRDHARCRLQLPQRPCQALLQLYLRLRSTSLPSGRHMCCSVAVLGSTTSGMLNRRSG